MEIPYKKLGSGFSMPVFGIGTWKIGGGFDEVNHSNDIKEVEAIQQAVNLGISHIDTAEAYASGHSEELVGEAIKIFDRAKLFIVSKVRWNNLSYNNVLNSCKRSLKRLGVNYLDLYLIHKPNPQIPISETMKAMNRLKDEGLIRNIGVSNFTVQRFKEAQMASTHKIVVNQVHYNLIYREVEKKGIVEFCQKNDVILIAWRPIQEGVLARKGIAILDLLSKKYNKTPAQIAINWLITQKNVVTISKMTDAKHISENLGAVGWKMEGQDIEKLRNEFPNQKQVSNAVPLI